MNNSQFNKANKLSKVKCKHRASLQTLINALTNTDFLITWNTCEIQCVFFPFLHFPFPIFHFLIPTFLSDPLSIIQKPGKGLGNEVPCITWALPTWRCPDWDKMLWCVNHALLTLAVTFGPLIMSWGFKIIILLYSMIFCILIITYSCTQPLLTCSSISGPWLYRIKDQTLTKLMRSKYVPLHTCYQLMITAINNSHFVFPSPFAATEVQQNNQHN